MRIAATETDSAAAVASASSSSLHNQYELPGGRGLGARGGRAAERGALGTADGLPNRSAFCAARKAAKLAPSSGQRAACSATFLFRAAGPLRGTPATKDRRAGRAIDCRRETSRSVASAVAVTESPALANRARNLQMSRSAAYFALARARRRSAEADKCTSH